MSFTVRFLSFIHWFHYVYVEQDTTRVTIVTSSRSARHLIRLSNAAAMRGLSVEEREELRRQFYQDGHVANYDAAVAMTECILGMCMSAWLYTYMRQHFWHHSTVQHTISSFLLVLWNIACSVRLSKAARAYRRACAPTAGQSEHVEVELATIQNTPSSVEAVATPSCEETHVLNTFFLIVAQRYYFESIQEKHVSPSAQASIAFEGKSTYMLYAMRCRENFTEHVMTSVSLTEKVMYLCYYNPTTDPPLLEMIEPVRKASGRDVALLVIFPPLEQLANTLARSKSARLHTGKEQRFISDVCDFCALLQKLDSGIFPHVALVMPVEGTPAESNELWQVISQIVKTKML